LPARRAREAFEAARWDDDVKTDAEMWEAAMGAAYPSMRDEYVRLSIERDDARGERDQASASYQRAAAERDRHAARVTELESMLADLAAKWDATAAVPGDLADDPDAYDGTARSMWSLRARLYRNHAAALRKHAALED
jgi:hypothetical protein